METWRCKIVLHTWIFLHDLWHTDSMNTDLDSSRTKSTIRAYVIFCQKSNLDDNLSAVNTYLLWISLFRGSSVFFNNQWGELQLKSWRKHWFKKIKSFLFLKAIESGNRIAIRFYKNMKACATIKEKKLTIHCSNSRAPWSPPPSCFKSAFPLKSVCNLSFIQFVHPRSLPSFLCTLILKMMRTRLG